MIDPRRVMSLSSTWIAPVAGLGAVGVGVVFGLGPGLLALALGMLIGAVLLVWSSLERLTGESPLTLDEAIGLGAPSPEEERKRSIVRALKDLQYERSVGKISEEDYAELSARYRGEAKTLLRSLDAELAPGRKKAEDRLAARLEQEGLLSQGTAAGADRSVGGDDAGGGSNATPAGSPCAKCGTLNDADASFCKRCGTALGREVQP